MIIIIGLGNPGDTFNNTRHNVGFAALDFFAKQNQFPEFTLSKKYHSLISEKENMLLAKPQTFMNESGKAVKLLIKNKEQPSIIIIHDDIDLPLGTLKIVKDRGSAGHKGIDSIIQTIKNEGLIRFRVGIGTDNQAAKEVVLKKFTSEETHIMETTLAKIAQALHYFIENGLEKTMNEYNR